MVALKAYIATVNSSVYVNAEVTISQEYMQSRCSDLFFIDGNLKSCMKQEN